MITGNDEKMKIQNEDRVQGAVIVLEGHGVPGQADAAPGAFIIQSSGPRSPPCRSTVKVSPTFQMKRLRPGSSIV